MPVSIYKLNSYEEVDYLCEGSFNLPEQTYALKVWLDKEGVKLVKDKYVADIGFTVREGCSGGGGVIDLEMINILGDIGMEIFLSEYPEGD